MYLNLLVVGWMASVSLAQVPSIGWCPDKRPMQAFDVEKYLGTWYEQERYFTVLEAGSRCARTNYTMSVDGRVLVTNEITNRLTGIKRVIDGEIRDVPKRGEPSFLRVKYSTLPLPMETQYTILETDYDTYSVVWACSSFGPLVNSQSAWVMTRERQPSGTIMQKAYGVLDKHKITRTFFVRADQDDCNIGEPVPEDGTVPIKKAATADDPVVAASENKEEVKPLKEVVPLKEGVDTVKAEEVPVAPVEPVANVELVKPVKEEKEKV